MTGSKVSLLRSMAMSQASTGSDEKIPTQALCLGGDGVYAMIVHFSL